MKTLLILIATLAAYSAFSQTDSSSHEAKYDTIRRPYTERHFSLVTGANGIKKFFAEAGFAIKDNGVAGHHPSTRILALTSEISFINRLVIGPKLGIWLGGGSAGMNMGFNLIYYTNFSEATLRFRPEIGMGFNRFRIVYGYNLLVVNRNSDFINKHNFGLNFLIDLKKLNKSVYSN